MIENSKILITGSNSMLGRHTRNELYKTNNTVFGCVHSSYDLLSLYDTEKAFRDASFNEVTGIWRDVDYVIHLSGYNGNIGFSQKYPADIFYQTSQMGLNVLKCCQKYKVKKVISILSSCAIADGENPLKAENLWNGLPNETIEAHGFAKRMLHAYSRQLYKQYGLNAICAIVNNSFGEWDNTDINKTKAVMGIIKRIVDAYRQNLPSVTCWGSGNVYREFIYATDAANGILQALEKYNDPITPINITSPNEISIKDLTHKIADIVGYKGEILWDTSKPDGQIRKSLDPTEMNKYMSIEFTPMEKALENTIHWYKRLTK